MKRCHQENDLADASACHYPPVSLAKPSMNLAPSVVNAHHIIVGLDAKLGTMYVNCCVHNFKFYIFLDFNSDLFKIAEHLKNLENNHIIAVGGALGLSSSKLRKMYKYPDDMVAAWLRREDSVMSISGEPTWRTLVKALRKVGQEGIARDIEMAEV